MFDHSDDEADERAIREGEADADAGRVLPHEKVAQWLATWGTPDERQIPKSWLK
ncbi:MAG: antitoxin [Caulobacterales bacterium]